MALEVMHLWKETNLSNNVLGTYDMTALQPVSAFASL